LRLLYGYKVVCHADQSYSKPVEIYRGDDALKSLSKIFLEKFNPVRK